MVEQGWSKLHRFWLVRVRAGYVAENLSKRQGECRRCALCCKVFFQCPFLDGETCRIYLKRFHQCKAFPIDRRDVNLIAKMGGRCGFYFEEEKA